ncbi:MAG: Gfo/Idh/MocA family oxidoreductase [Pseudomonadota bacterium]
MNIAFLGCGYVANMYRLSLGGHPELNLVGVYDVDTQRSAALADTTNCSVYSNFDALIADTSVDLVLNLTNPSAHYETSKALLEAGKHVFTEKPITLSLEQSQRLTDLANERGLFLTSAPCTVHSPAAKALFEVVRSSAVGTIRAVYAEMDDGMVHRAPFKKWVNELGVAWPYADEFEVGCTLEHAGYVLSWLCALFGPVTRMTSFYDTLVEDKVPGETINNAADFSVACLAFESGVVARLTNGIYAPKDHALRVFGDDGITVVADPRSDTSKVWTQRYHKIRRRRFLSPLKRQVKLKNLGDLPKYRGSQVRDFCRSIAHMKRCIETGQSPVISNAYWLHIAEITLACQGLAKPSPDAMSYVPQTHFDKSQFVGQLT